MDTLLCSLFKITTRRVNVSAEVHHVLNIVSLDWMPRMVASTAGSSVCLTFLHVADSDTNLEQQIMQVLFS